MNPHVFVVGTPIPITKAHYTRIRPPCQFDFGRAGFLLPKNQKKLGYGVWNMEHKGGCRSYPPLAFPLPLSLSFLSLKINPNIFGVASYTILRMELARGYPLTPFTKCALILNKVECASCGAFPPLAFATAPKGGSNPLEHIARRC